MRAPLKGDALFFDKPATKQELFLQRHPWCLLAFNRYRRKRGFAYYEESKNQGWWWVFSQEVLSRRDDAS